MKIVAFRKKDSPPSCCSDTTGSCCGDDTPGVAPDPSGKGEGCCCGSTNSEAAPDQKPPCCGPAATHTGGEVTERLPGFLGWLETPAGAVARVDTCLSLSDTLGAWRVRWGIGRMSYVVPAALYAIGTPDHRSPVVVTCNYKMTWDLVRRALHGRSAWLLALQTYGVNVWCAAGKGTFGTDELVRRIERTGLARVVSHRRLILPVLGAVGVSAHRVKQRCGFEVVYATTRASDLPRWLDGGMVTTHEMREVTFTLGERAALVPVEVIQGVRQILPVSLLVGGAVWGLDSAAGGIVAAAGVAGAMLCGTVIGPLVLPLLPFRYFSANGALLGLVGSLFLAVVTRFPRTPAGVAASLLFHSAVAGYYLLAFTGCTPYTSRTGVKREMRRSLPVMGVAVALAAVCAVVAVVSGGG